MPKRNVLEIRKALALLSSCAALGRITTEYLGPDTRFIAIEDFGRNFLKANNCALKSLRKKDFDNYGKDYGLTWGHSGEKMGVFFQRFVNKNLR